RTILLVGFFAALRRSELAALAVPSVLAGDCIELFVSKSKVDQVRNGRVVCLAARTDELCPVRALQEWVVVAGLRAGPLFPASLASTKCVSPQTVSRIVKRRVGAVGLAVEQFSGHSLRAGYATSAALSGHDATIIARHTGHKTLQTLSGYVRPRPASQL